MKTYTKTAGIKIPKSDVLNTLTYEDYLARLQELSLNTFLWTGLPDEIDKRFLELALFSTGLAVFYWEDVVERYIALTCMIGGDLDIYQVPKRRRAYAVNGYNCELNDTNSVLIFNNYLRSPDFPTLELYAKKLYQIDRSIMTNVSNQRFPAVVKCAESQRLTMANLFQKYDGNEPLIMAGPNLDLSGIDVIDLKAPFVADKLYDIKDRVWTEALNFLGIETANKKTERLLADEVSANLGYAHAQRFVRLNMRRQACEQINKMFGLDAWVDFNADINSVYNGSQQERETEDPFVESDPEVTDE